MEMHCAVKFLGIAKKNGSVLKMPPEFSGVETYQVFEFEGRIILIPMHFEPAAAEEVERLARETVEEHRKTLEALTR